MLPSDLELFQHAIKLANSGQKTVAYQQLLALYRINNNQNDTNLVLWLAFTTPNLTEAEQAVDWASTLAPNDPNVASARNWLEAEKARQQGYAPVRSPLPSLEQALLSFKRDFGYYCQDGIITQEEWATLTRSAANNGLGLDQALAYIRPEAVNFISQTIDLAAEDGFISYDEERNVYQLINLLALPPEHAAPLQQRLQWLKTLTQIRQGELPSIDPHIALNSGEIAHFEIQALLEGHNGLPGWLVATNRRLVYSGKPYNFEIELSNVRSVFASSNKVEIQLVAAKISHSFITSDAALVKPAIEMLIKLNQRVALAKKFTNTLAAKLENAKEPQKVAPSSAKKGSHLPSPIEKLFFETWEIYNQHQPLVITLVPEYQVFDAKYRVDFAHVETKTAIELDGFQAHSSTEQIAKDRRREREIRNTGWEFIRFGGKEINQNVYGCVGEIYDKIHRRILEAEPKSSENETTYIPPGENTVYKPARIKLLFVEEFNLNKGGKSFYRANSNLFYRTREVFSEFFKTEWKTPDDFLSFFQTQGCYLLALGNAVGDEPNSELIHKQRNEAVALLAKRLANSKPDTVVVIMSGISPYIRKALVEAGFKDTPVEVLPYPSKDYQTLYRDKLFRLLGKLAQ